MGIILGLHYSGGQGDTITRARSLREAVATVMIGMDLYLMCFDAGLRLTAVSLLTVGAFKSMRTDGNSLDLRLSISCKPYGADTRAVSTVKGLLGKGTDSVCHFASAFHDRQD